ncbi:Lrp/AsnC family transcriptional regulator [Candidatus Woesearchaeota archaeon]|nr:Lrp/AsnC family transcriptional regulator [Candidatus Woesearchaeota archaeon]
MELEEIDRKILNVLVDDSRLSLRQIAAKIGVSVATVMHHIDKLEKESIVKNYTARLNYEKIGYDIEVIIEVRISKGRLLDVEKKIAVHPNVFAVYDVTGAFDAIILARFKTRRQMDNFLKKIQTYEFVERTETKLVLQTIKEDNIKVE